MMGRALFTAVTGLKAQQTKLDVVANNIANVNTTGYRSSRILFQDLFSQQLSGPSAPAGNFGGTNPMQVGLGDYALFFRKAAIEITFEDEQFLVVPYGAILVLVRGDKVPDQLPHDL